MSDDNVKNPPRPTRVIAALVERIDAIDARIVDVFTPPPGETELQRARKHLHEMEERGAGETFAASLTRLRVSWLETSYTLRGALFGITAAEARARHERAVKSRRRRWIVVRFGAAVLVVSAVGAIADAAIAAPPPNAAAPLAWPTRSVEAAAHRWLEELAPDALGDGVRLVSHEWACERTKRRPARYRCEGAALWMEAGEYVETREVLSACRPSDDDWLFAWSAGDEERA